MIHDWFRLNPDLKPLYGLEDISSLKWMGDDKIFELLQFWREIVGSNTIKLDHKQLASILESKIPIDSKALGHDIAY